MPSKEDFIFDELKAMVGKGSGLYSLDSEDSLYSLLIPSIEVPIPSKTVNSVEIKVACSTSVGKIESTTTVDDAEATFYVHRDTLRILESVNGKMLHLLAKTGDYTGFKFDGTISYSVDNIQMDEAVQGTITIVPATEPEFVDDVYPLIKPTAKFVGAIPATVELAITTGKEKVAYSVWPSDATVTAQSDTQGVATVQATGGVATITGVAEGSAIVDLTVSKEGYASWKTSIHVIVPPAAS